MCVLTRYLLEVQGSGVGGLGQRHASQVRSGVSRSLVGCVEGRDPRRAQSRQRCHVHLVVLTCGSGLVRCEAEAGLRSGVASHVAGCGLRCWPGALCVAGCGGEHAPRACPATAACLPARCVLLEQHWGSRLLGRRGVQRGSPCHAGHLFWGCGARLTRWASGTKAQLVCCWALVGQGGSRVQVGGGSRTNGGVSTFGTSTTATHSPLPLLVWGGAQPLAAFLVETLSHPVAGWLPGKLKLKLKLVLVLKLGGRCLSGLAR